MDIASLLGVGLCFLFMILSIVFGAGISGVLHVEVQVRHLLGDLRQPAHRLCDAHRDEIRDQRADDHRDDRGKAVI